jgi:hypothetical protein
MRGVSTALPINALDEANLILAAHRPIQEGLERVQAFVIQTYADLEEESVRIGHFDADRLDREVRAYLLVCVRETYLEHVEAIYGSVMNRLLTPIMDRLMEQCGEDAAVFEHCCTRAVEEYRVALPVMRGL